MPLRLTVGVSKKLGMPAYSSVGASCNIELEVESRLLESNLDDFHEQVRSAYRAAELAVNDELARLQAFSSSLPVITGDTINRDGHVNGSKAHANGTPVAVTGPRGGTNGTRGRTMRPASPAQVKAIHAIARSQHINLGSVLRHAYGVEHAEDLSLPDAGKLIDQLKASGHS